FGLLAMTAGNRRRNLRVKMAPRWPMLRRTLLVVVVAVVVAGGAAVAVAWRPAIDPVRSPAPGSFDPALVKRGGELAAIGNCATCHTVPGGRPFAGGLAVPTPFGTIYSTNITPDERTGIGTWSEEAFRRAGRYQPDGNQSAEWNRGAYLANGLAHCGACHTPRNALGAEERQKSFAGGEAEGWTAYALDAASPAPMPWDAAALLFYLHN